MPITRSSVETAIGLRLRANPYCKKPEFLRLIKSHCDHDPLETPTGHVEDDEKPHLANRALDRAHS